ncbi:MAG: hypothetical protein EXX96DRAFT_536289 [Benjaminiella poitrasii]|nr:MAG: hypothetical protein EXX96DRAFT_536289 [Benjaminiella poitrasii]
MEDHGSWINKENKRTKYSNSIKEFLLRDEETFRLKFFGACEYAENNYDPVKAIPTSGFSGVFKNINNSCRFVGVVNEDSKIVKKYTSEVDNVLFNDNNLSVGTIIKRKAVRLFYDESTIHSRDYKIMKLVSRKLVHVLCSLLLTLFKFVGAIYLVNEVVFLQNLSQRWNFFHFEMLYLEKLIQFRSIENRSLFGFLSDGEKRWQEFSALSW